MYLQWNDDCSIQATNRHKYIINSQYDVCVFFEELVQMSRCFVSIFVRSSPEAIILLALYFYEFCFSNGQTGLKQHE